MDGKLSELWNARAGIRTRSAEMNDIHERYPLRYVRSVNICPKHRDQWGVNFKASIKCQHPLHGNREGKAALTRTWFHIDKVSWLRNRVKIDAVWKCLHGIVFASKSKSWWHKRALHYVLNSLFQIEHRKSHAKIATIFKLMRFRCLQDRWNRIVLKTLHFWQ